MSTKTHSRYLCCQVVLLIFIAIGTSGCSSTSSTYSKISFCWTTNHRMAPTKRMISVDASPLSVKNALVKWASLHAGEIITESNDYDKRVIVRPEGMARFQIVNDITENKWKSYETNKYIEWRGDEFKNFQNMSETQIEELPSLNMGWKLFVKMGKREGSINVQEKNGSQMTYAPGFFLNGAWIQPAPVMTTRYKTVKKTLSFYSIVRFYIFENEGKTFVCAHAFPRDETSQVEAGYGHSIGYRWREYIDARQEVNLVKDAFHYLQTTTSEAADKSEDFWGRHT
jgi:hypothetical protein